MLVRGVGDLGGSNVVELAPLETRGSRYRSRTGNPLDSPTPDNKPTAGNPYARFDDRGEKAWSRSGERYRRHAAGRW